MSLFTHEADAARQEELYAFLLERGDQWTEAKLAVACVPGYPVKAYVKNFHNSHGRRMLTKDIEAINLSRRFDKIIISGSRGIKLATQDEYRRFVAAEYREIFAKLSRVRGIARKGSLDQQQDIEGEIREAFLEGV